MVKIVNVKKLIKFIKTAGKEVEGENFQKSWISIKSLIKKVPFLVV